LGIGNRAVTDRLIEALDDGSGTQMALISLRTRGDAAALPALDRIAASDALPGIVRQAQSAAEAIRRPANAARPPAAAPATDELRTRLTQLERENAELKSRIDRLEKK
jgi:uncharacterized protein YceH (UPF0502 family)